MINAHIVAMVAVERRSALLAQAATARAAKRARPGPGVAARSEPRRRRMARTGQPATETAR